MEQKNAFLALCVIGFIGPWAFLLGFLAVPEPGVSLFFTSIFANSVSSAVAADLLISALVFFVFVFLEGRRLGMQRLWIFVPATLFVGLSFGFPLFLYFRARALEKALQQ